MSGRGGVRSSARLSGDSGATATAAGTARPASTTTGVVAAPGTPGPTVRVAPGRGRPVATTAAAALRRARAAERAREVEDSPRVLRDKCRRLARALRNAKHLVVYTGAGISTAADIPDYRGPDGVWTRLQRGEAVRRVEVSRARPTFTHMALSALWARGALKFVVSQNCDGLHLRAGLPRRALAELHGDMFAELCAACRRVYLRAFDTTERTARHQHATRRLCHACGAELRDSIVHFGERGRAAWPLNWAGALRHAARADVVLCLGSSLKVLRRYPRLWRMQSAPRARPALYIVNLQWTPKDSVAALKINARCDAVMRQVARRLRLPVPRYRASRDPLLAHAEPLAPPEAHTTRRPLLRAEPADRAPSPPEEPSSPSASDSDEELPLRRLADRLRAPDRPPDRVDARSPDHSSDRPPDRPTDRSPDRPSNRPPDRPSDRPSDRSPDRPFDRPPDRPPDHPCDFLRAFRVDLETGEATILLRSEHAPSHEPTSPPRRRPADLRTFRMARRRLDSRPNLFNGHGAPPDEPRPRPASSLDDAKPLNGTADLDSKLRRLLEYEPRIDASDEPKDPPGDRDAPAAHDALVSWAAGDTKTERKVEPKCEPKAEPKDEVKAEESSSDSESGALAAGSLAAAIFRRAVLLCRASLYPGLHTIIAPAPAAGGGGGGGAAGEAERGAAECAWCSRHFAARRCLWYGPPREPAPGARVWRRVRGRRYLCACCGAGESPPRTSDAAPDEGGWYGKGYRKGRRRRR